MRYEVSQEPKDVCPACAGMIRDAGGVSCGVDGLPRMRGDDPNYITDDQAETEFAPHARG